MQKNQIQIDKELFVALYRYFWQTAEDIGADERAELTEYIENGLRDKLNKLIERNIFTAYKRAGTAEEREKFRNEYLDRRGISQSFRSDDEKRYESI
jgi:hypothetical protein